MVQGKELLKRILSTLAEWMSGKLIQRRDYGGDIIGCIDCVCLLNIIWLLHVADHVA